MEHREKIYTVVQGIRPSSWIWTVHLDDRTEKSGEAVSRRDAQLKAVAIIDKALAPKRSKLVPPANS